MRPEEARWLLAIVNEQGDEKLSRLVVWTLELDRTLLLVAPSMGAQPVDVFVPGQAIPDDLSVSWRRPVRDIRALAQRRSAWLATKRHEAPPRRGRPRGVNPADADIRADLARAVAAVWSHLAVVIAGDSGATAARRRRRVVATVHAPAEKPSRVNVGSFPLTLGSWLLRRRGLYYSEIAERLAEVSPGVNFDDLRSRASKYVRVADRAIALRSTPI